MNKKGFTLIELLVVIAVLGILAAVVLVAIDPAERIKSARDSGARSDIGQLATALEAYYTDNEGYYPDALADLSPSYLKNIPSAPTGSTNSYVYTGYDSAGNNCATSGNPCVEGALYYQLEAASESTTPYYCYETAAGKTNQYAAAASCDDS